jgi:hypothetical protein
MSWGRGTIATASDLRSRPIPLVVGLGLAASFHAAADFGVNERV